jgi:hypothetical protein
MSWEQLSSMLAEARALDAEEATKVPVDCPNDFTPLREGPDGQLFCPFDGWQYPQDA